MSKTPHANNSFASLVAQTSNKQIKEDVKPYIDSLVIEKVAQVAGIVENNMKKFISKTLMKATAIEELLLEKNAITVEDITNKVMDLEDLSWSATKTDAAAELTNVVRLVARTKKEGQEYGLPYNIIVPSVGIGASEIGKETESELIGLKAGDKKEVVVGPVTFEFTVTRVSTRKALESVKQG